MPCMCIRICMAAVHQVPFPDNCKLVDELGKAIVAMDGIIQYDSHVNAYHDYRYTMRNVK